MPLDAGDIGIMLIELLTPFPPTGREFGIDLPAEFRRGSWRVALWLLDEEIKMVLESLR